MESNIIKHQSLGLNIAKHQGRADDLIVETRTVRVRSEIRIRYRFTKRRELLHPCCSLKPSTITIHLEIPRIPNINYFKVSANCKSPEKEVRSSLYLASSNKIIPTDRINGEAIKFQANYRKNETGRCRRSDEGRVSMVLEVPKPGLLAGDDDSNHVVVATHASDLPRGSQPCLHKSSETVWILDRRGSRFVLRPIQRPRLE